MRTYKKTSCSLLKNIINKNNADLYVYCFENEGISPLSTQKEINEEKRINGNKWDDEGDVVSEASLYQQYGERLVHFSINKYNKNKFISESKDIFSPILPIERCYSLYYNITNAVAMFKQYCEDNEIEYDGVLVTRPDLMFYDTIDFEKFDLSSITVPAYGGNYRFREKPQPYYVCYYKNVFKGELIPWNEIIFSDQFIFSSYANMVTLESLYSSLGLYNSNGLPVCHPETVLYYHLAYQHDISHTNVDINYEILRNDAVEIENEITLAFPIVSDKNDCIPNSKKSSVKFDLVQYTKNVIKAVLNK